MALIRTSISSFFVFFISIFIIGYLLLPTKAYANESRDIRRAEKLLATGDFEAAFTQYQQLATTQNNALAKQTMAMFYDYGWGRKQDMSKACFWYEKAAQDNIPLAANALANCFEQGVYHAKDYAQAAMWYEKAASLGHHFSYCHLGALYIKGLGVEKNKTKGISLCEKSAKQGSIAAMLTLGDINLSLNAKATNKIALEWFAMAASYHSSKAQYQLGIMLRDGLGVKLNKAEALQWFEKSAAQGYVPAYYQTALLYYNSPKKTDSQLWDERMLAKAYLWLSVSAKQSQVPYEVSQAKTMLNDVLTIMPATWVESLDKKVIKHLNKHDLPHISKAS